MGDGRVMGVRKVFQGIPVGMEGFGYKSGLKHQGSEFQAGRVRGQVWLPTHSQCHTGNSVLI